MEAITREEKIMSGENLTPITRKEMFLAKAVGQDVKTPEPITREEMFLSKIGGGGNVEQFDKYFSGEDVELTVNVDRVRDFAFAEAFNLKAIILPNATEIGVMALANCTILESIEMPNVEYIGEAAFMFSFGAISLKIPSSVKVIDIEAFSDCGIAEVTFEGTPESIASNTFQGCQNLETINVPWSFGEVDEAPWGATSATINYNYKGD
jgi:hypothetical protein